MLESGWEASAKQTYFRALRVHVQGAEEIVDDSPLPLDAPDKLMILFTSMDGMRWDATRINNAAVWAWRARRNM
eukprot:8362337-Pyramimonas_sp.AAC.1